MDERQRQRARLLDDAGRARAPLAGRGTSSRGRRRALWAFLLLIGCALFGAHASFVPSPVWRGVGIALAAAVALSFLVAVRRSRATGTVGRVRGGRSLVMLLTAAVVGLLAWQAIVFGAGDLAARSLGHAATLEDVVLPGPASRQRSTAGARRLWRCSRRLYLGTLSGALPAYVCADPAGDALRAGTRIRIDGRASAFGLHVERVAALEAARD